KPMLEAIVANCHGRWGGRFSLLVPCEEGQIRAVYVPWLKAYDPDIIYSYVDLTDSQVERLHERFYPSFLVRHHFYDDAKHDKHAYRPNLPLAPLTSLSVSLIAARGNAIAEPQPVTLVDSHPSAPDSAFLQDNFGFYHNSLNPWPLPHDMADYVRTLTVVPSAVRSDRSLMPRAEGEAIDSELAMLRQISERRNLIGLA